MSTNLNIYTEMNSPEDKTRIREKNDRLNQEERSARKEVLDSFPVNVISPTGTRCNNRCIFCTDRSPGALSHYADLPFEKWVKLSEPLEYATSLGLYGWGEPLFNPDYEKMFDYVVENFKGIEINITTNGILMNGKWTEKFLSYDKLSINVSLNASTAKTYKLLSGTDQFDRIIENIRRIKDSAEEKGTTSPEIVLSFVAIKENIVELPDFIRLAADLRIKRVVVQDLIILHEGLRKHSLTSYADFAKSIFLVALNLARGKGVLLVPFVPVYFLPTDSDAFVENGKIERKNSAGFCLEPWTNLRISSEGEIKPCCFSDQIMGNLYEQKLAEIWNGEKYRYLRKYVNSQALPEDCRRCPKKVGATL